MNANPASQIPVRPLISAERMEKINGVFGLSPGIELALVSSAQGARRFHLWEASPLEYLERLHFQNLLVPFDVIPCRPAGGLLAFIEETLAAGHTLRAVGTVTT